VVAVAAVVVGLIRAVLERRRAPRLWEQYRSRRIDPQRLERAVPGPTAKDGTIRALEQQAPAMGSRPGFAAFGAPVAVELIGDSELGPDDASPAHPYAYAYARESDAPDSEIESAEIQSAEIGSAAVASAVLEPEATIEPEVVEADMAPAESVTTEPDAAESDTAIPEPETEPESEPGLSDAAMAELGIVASRKRPAGKRGSAPTVEEPVETAVPVETAEPETVEPAAASAGPVDEPAEEPAAASSEPVPLFLPGTYTVGAADAEEPAIKRDDAPATAARAAAMTAGYAPTARAVFVPPPPDVIEDELAYRIGVRGARRPSQSMAVEAADGPEALAPVLPTVETESWPERRSRRRRRAAIGMTTIAAAIVLAVGASTLPGLIEQGGVLGETGQPPASPAGGVALETPSQSVPPATGQPPSSPEPQASPSSAPPSPSPTASATPRPTRNVVRPPIARFDCTSVGLVLTCDGSKSSGATAYLWDFGEGSKESGVTASHAYAASASYLVTLVVTGQSGSTSRSQSFIVP
jgi:chitodextrinase